MIRKVKKTGKQTYKLSWKKKKGFYYNINYQYATHKLDKIYPLKLDLKNVDTCTVEVKEDKDCFFFLNSYQLVDGVKVYSEFTRVPCEKGVKYPAIAVDKYCLDISYPNGVSNTFVLMNNTNKDMKYITITVVPYSTSGKRIQFDGVKNSEISLVIKGPLYANAYSPVTFNNVWYYSYTDYAKITKAVVEYEDGKKETVKMDVKSYWK